eukprot:m.296267 g.296267  ORF g.296267 m.296267 type:complete len:132 (-) comp20055_c0_seq4:1990-2385(-)
MYSITCSIGRLLCHIPLFEHKRSSVNTNLGTGTQERHIVGIQMLATRQLCREKTLSKQASPLDTVFGVHPRVLHYFQLTTESIIMCTRATISSSPHCTSIEAVYYQWNTRCMQWFDTASTYGLSTAQYHEQ